MDFHRIIFRFRRRIKPAVWIGLSAFALASALFWLPAWQTLERRGFDLLTVMTAPGTTPLPIILIAIDDASLQQVKHPWPWPRSLHAGLIDKLKDAGAAVIAFDILFSQATRPEEDRKLADSIRRAGNVVLATGLVRQETPVGTLWARQEPMAELIAAGAQPGVVNLMFDPDMVMRRLPTDSEAFWRRILIRLRQAMPEQELPGVAPEGSLIRYVGPPGSFPTLPYHMALELEKHLKPEELDGTVVIIGRSTRSATDIGLAQADLFATPYTLISRELTPGTEIHANILDSVIRQQSIRPLPQAVQTGVLALLCLLGSLAFSLRRRWMAYGSLLVLAAALFGLAWAVFAHLQWWLPIGLPLVALLLLGSGHFLRASLAARHERDRVERMFALYVPPDVVKALVANPDQVGLGGETRRLTVMFCDLRGFTTLSSQLAPAQITAVLNRYFTRMTKAIFDHGGTVDKFIGDAVMAFWGAPLADAEQERHAIDAARAMRDSLTELNAELAAEGRPPLRLGIGLHTGDALVGNMGSESRLSYTAIGDAVNVASRLEGANKSLGTEILLSGETAQGADDQPLRPLGSIRVKGREEPIPVLSPCTDLALITATRAALAGQLELDRDSALALWQAVLEQAPGDPLAVQAMGKLTTDPDWDGVLETDK